MASTIWRGDAPLIAQVSTTTVNAFNASTTYKLTINGKVVSVAGDTDTNTTAQNLIVAWNASIIPEFTEVTATRTNNAITLTADVKGRPFTVTSSVTGGTGNMTAVSNTTTASGPNDWNVAQNWSGGSVPANTNDVYIENSDVDILYGLSQASITLNSLNIGQSYTGKIGLPRTNEQVGSGNNAYYEYRTDYLSIGATTVRIGYGEGQGSGRIKLNTGSIQTTLIIENAGAPAETGIPSILFKGTHASNAAHISKGSLGVAFFGTETATLTTLNVGFRDNQASDSEVFAGAGATLTTVTKMGGYCMTRSAITTLNMRRDSGVFEHWDGNVTTVNGEGGTFIWRGDDTITTFNVGGDITIDASKDPRSKTITTLAVKSAGPQINDPAETLTITNSFALPAGVQISDIGLNLGGGKTLTIA